MKKATSNTVGLPHTAIPFLYNLPAGFQGNNADLMTRRPRFVVLELPDMLQRPIHDLHVTSGSVQS